MAKSQEIAPEKLRNEFQQGIMPYFRSDNHVLMCCQGQSGTRIDACLLTESHLISAFNDFGIVGSRAVKLVDILSIDESVRKQAYHVTAHGLGTDCDCIFYAQPRAHKFQQTLEQAIQRAKANASQASPEPPLNVEERLKRLTRLHDAKLISDVEFEQKRKAILDEL